VSGRAGEGRGRYHRHNVVEADQVKRVLADIDTDRRDRAARDDWVEQAKNFGRRRAD